LKMPRQDITFKVIRKDDMPAFGGWKVGSLLKQDPVILLNVAAAFDPYPEDINGEVQEMDAKERRYLLIETLMHEFGHALEEFFGEEFDDERIEQIVEDYRKGWYAEE